MTVAVCFKCGQLKFGALVPCASCSAKPQNEEEVLLSVAMTDHYFSQFDLEQIGADIAKHGTPPRLAEETRDELLAALQNAQSQTPGIGQLMGLQAQPMRKPWWKFW